MKLWQTWTLASELDRFTSSRGLPLILCGDFNSEPNSSVHALLGSRHHRVPAEHPDLALDTLGVLPQASKMRHQIPLQSAYAVAEGAEPKYTNYTGHYKGVLDYQVS